MSSPIRPTDTHMLRSPLLDMPWHVWGGKNGCWEVVACRSFYFCMHINISISMPTYMCVPPCTQGCKLVARVWLWTSHALVTATPAWAWRVTAYPTVYNKSGYSVPEILSQHQSTNYCVDTSLAWACGHTKQCRPSDSPEVHHWCIWSQYFSDVSGTPKKTK